MFVAYEVALELIRQLRPVMPAFKAIDSDFEDNLRRALNSVMHNLAEGKRRRGGDKRKAYEYAAGSASEVLGALDAAEAWGYATDLGPARTTVDRLMALCYGLVKAQTQARMTPLTADR
jgi:four helix bundle protein